MEHKLKLNLISCDDFNKKKYNMKLYIAGRMAGLDYSRTLKKFMAELIEMEERGFEVLTPFHNEFWKAFYDGNNIECSWKDHMKADLKLIKSCDGVAFLPDWKDSKGARIEYWFAKRYGKVIYFLEEI